MTVGWREVAEKRRRGLGTAARSAPAVIGPKGSAYVLDCHHSLCARQQQGETVAAVHIVEDLQHLPHAAFWRRMDHLGWCRPYDANGQRRAFRHMPERLVELGDDPFRSLASALRHQGGFSKSAGLFSEFRWADHLRTHIAQALVERDFETAVETALQLARRPEAAGLPGSFG
ncbi:ParB-like protein [Brevundimonas sp. UBA7534]|uniref:ParB-like protein n=1 Tax=Brevundimonas TaxID=41275 RepID=UPI001C860A07